MTVCVICEARAVISPIGLCATCSSRPVLVEAYTDGNARLRPLGEAHAAASRPVVPGVPEHAEGRPGPLERAP